MLKERECPIALYTPDQVKMACRLANTYLTIYEAEKLLKDRNENNVKIDWHYYLNAQTGEAVSVHEVDQTKGSFSLEKRSININRRTIQAWKRIAANSYWDLSHRKIETSSGEKWVEDMEGKMLADQVISNIKKNLMEREA